MMPVLALTAVLALAVVSPVAADGLRIGIDITPPPPPRIVLTAPPQLVVVPGSPVFYAPGVSVNFFAYGGRYYSLHEGAWFMATAYGGPWTTISAGRVPPPVLAVPVAYYKIPPGHAKKMHRDGVAGRRRTFRVPAWARQARALLGLRGDRLN